MDDRELLELAAKAAGMTVGRCRLGDPLNRDFLMNGSSPRNIGQVLFPWNPLTDDGDVLRLAVKTSILRCHMDLFHRFYDEEIAQERQPAEATRRAFVRAAAEIGRAMP